MILIKKILGSRQCNTYSDLRIHIFDPDSQIHNEFFYNNRTLSVEAFCLYHFLKISNVRRYYDNGGGYVHQTNDTVREFHLHLYDSKLQNDATTTANLYTLLDMIFEKNK